MSRFQPKHAFEVEGAYHFLPFRFIRFKAQGRVLLTNEVGEFYWLRDEQFKSLANSQMPVGSAAFQDLESKHLVFRAGASPPITALATKYRTKKQFVHEGPSLHIFVVTLRCDHSCQYCQVSRRIESDGRYDMTSDDAAAAVELALRSPSKELVVEFQGGEPLLAFERIRQIVMQFGERNASFGKRIKFVVASTLHHLTSEMLEFFKAHAVDLSTSLDGPPDIHNTNRPLPARDSYQRTVAGIALARKHLGAGSVAALTTLTAASLGKPEPVIDEYVNQQFHSIFLRPLSPYGFATRGQRFADYTVADFLRFYRRAMDYLLEVNRGGYQIEEAYTALLLRSILTPFSHGYMDLRSPQGAGLGVLVYNYDGGVYASDEARMLVEMGEQIFRLGSVRDSYETLLQSPAMQVLLSGGVAEAIPVCADCAFLPYCGSDPVDSFARQGDVVGHRPSSPFCEKQMGIFGYIFEKLLENDPSVMTVFNTWAFGPRTQA